MRTAFQVPLILAMMVAALCSSDAVAAASEEGSEHSLGSFSVSTSTTSSQASTTTLSDDIERSFQISTYPTAPLRLLVLEVTWSAAIDEIQCHSIVDPVIIKIDHEYDPRFKATLTMDFGDAGLMQSQRIWVCKAIILQAEDAGGQPEVTVVQAVGLSGESVEGSEAACFDCRWMSEPSLDPDWTDTPNGYDTCGANFCGDANNSISYTTVDALRILRGAVSGFECPIPRCDVDRGGTVVTSDALSVLRPARSASRA